MFHLDDYFTYKVLEEDTVKHKPEAEPLLKYMEIAKAMKDECIYIGDMPSDIQCANNAFMAVSYTHLLFNECNKHNNKSYKS